MKGKRAGSRTKEPQTGPRIIDVPSTAVEGAPPPPPPPSFDGTLDGMARLIRVGDEGLRESRVRVVELLRGEEEMGKFVAAYDKLTRKNGDGSVTLDSAAEKAGVNRSVAIGSIAKVLHAHNFEVAKVAVTAVCARRAGEVAEALTEASLVQDPQASADRRLFLEASGVVQGRGGIQNIKVSNDAKVDASRTDVKVEEAKVIVVGRELPRFEDGVKQMAAKLRALPGRTEE